MSAVRVVALWSSAMVFPLPLVLVYDAIATEPVNQTSKCDGAEPSAWSLNTLRSRTG